VLLKQRHPQVSTHDNSSEQSGFGRKTDGITEFSILDGKTESTIVDGIWTENGKMANWTPKKIVKFFDIHWFYRNVFAVHLRKWIPRTISMKMEYFSFTKRATQITLGHTSPLKNIITSW